jgi:hypothetical protein
MAHTSRKGLAPPTPIPPFYFLTLIVGILKLKLYIANALFVILEV